MWKRLLRFLFPCSLACCLWPFCLRRKRSDDAEAEDLIAEEFISGMSEAPLTYLRGTKNEYEGSLNIKDSFTYFENKLVCLLENLIKDTCWKSRLLARNIISTSYTGISSATKGYLLDCYSKLCLDEDVCVRQVSVGKLPEFVKHIELESYNTHILPVFEAMIKDEEEVVRLQAVDSLISNISCLKLSEGLYHNLLALLHQFIKDSSWRVRFLVAVKILQVQANIGSYLISASLVPIYKELLRDPDENVRLTASSHWEEFSHLLKEDDKADVVKKLLPY